MANDAKTVDEIELPSADEILAMDNEGSEESEQQEQPEKGAKLTPEELDEKSAQEAKELAEKKEKSKLKDSPDAEENTEEAESKEDKSKEEETEEEKTEEASSARDQSDEAKQRGIKERLAVKKQVEGGLNTIPAYTPQTEEELVEEGMDPAMAGVEALRQQVRRGEIINELTDLNASINTDANTVLRDFPVYDPESKEYDEKFAKNVETLYKKYSNFTLDTKLGFVTRADFPLYEFFAFAAQARGSGVAQAQVQGQKSAEKMLSSAEEGSSAPPPKKSSTTGASEEDELWLAGLTGKKGTYSEGR